MRSQAVISADLIVRLRAALPEETPVLTPEEIAVPGQWQEEDAAGALVAGGGRGFHVYLKQHAPSGYIQVEEALGIAATGPVETFWCAFAAVAPTAAGAEGLMRSALLILCGIPGREPGYYTLVTPDAPRLIAPSAYLARPTVSRSFIGGVL